MSRLRYLVGAVPAIAMACLATAASTPAPAVQESWQAVVEWEDGNSDIVEHGVPLPDCLDRLIAYSGDPAAVVTYCEREG